MSTRLDRLIHMDALIRSGMYPSVQTFCQRFEVQTRTVYEDTRLLKERYHAPLKYSNTHRGYYYTDTTWQLPAMMVTKGQLLAFFLSVELAERYLGTAFEQPLRDAIHQLFSLLPDSVEVSVGELAKHYSVRSAATAKSSPELFLALEEAIQERHPVDMLYYTASRDQETRRVVHPYHLLNVGGEWYLIAYDLYRKEVRQFALPRIRLWHPLTHQQFETDPSFSIQDYFEQSFLAEHGSNVTEVVLHFDTYQARYVREHPWHPSQRIEEQPEGQLVLRFRTGALEEVKRRILCYGHHVKVIAPESLLHEITNELRATLQHYENCE